MQQAVPYWVWGPQGTSSSSSSSAPSCSTVTTGGGGSCVSEELKRMVAEKPVLVVGRRGCCMCHVVKRLLQGLGVNPAVCEVRDDIDETSLVDEYVDRQDPQDQMMTLPAVFIGGRLLGGLDQLMAVHISGDLVPILKDAGALWL